MGGGLWVMGRESEFPRTEDKKWQKTESWR